MDVVMRCCVANGPRALMFTPRWAVMQGAAGPVINLCNQGWSEMPLVSGSRVTLTQKTGYPRNGNVVITVDRERLEIFAWLHPTALVV